LTRAEFKGLAELPSEAEWFANNRQSKRASSSAMTILDSAEKPSLKER